MLVALFEERLHVVLRRRTYLREDYEALRNRAKARAGKADHLDGITRCDGCL